MKKNKARRDIISEQDYTMSMASASSDPENDSPGDSWSDAAEEFIMGLNYYPRKDLRMDGPEENMKTKYSRSRMKQGSKRTRSHGSTFS